MPQDSTIAASKNRAAQFTRGRAGEPLQLPSGAEIIARRVPLLTILRDEGMPHPLQVIVNKMIADTAKANPGANPNAGGDGGGAAQRVSEKFRAELTATIMGDPINLIGKVGGVALCLCSLDPKFVDGEAASDDEVSLSAVELADKVYMFNWLAGTEIDVSSFRGFTT